MSKNLTRKSVAFGAIVALGTTLFAGTPALAADAVTLEPSTGTSYNTLLTEQFVLSSYFTSAAKQGNENLKFKIVDASKKLLLSSASAGYLSSASYDTDAELETLRSAAAITAGGSQITDGAGTNLTASDGTYVVAGGTTAGPTKNFLVLTPQTSLTASFDVTVQSWLDFNDNNLIDGTEAFSAVRTVGFKAAADVTTTIDLTQPIEKDTNVSANFSFSNLNNEQLSYSYNNAEFGIYLTDSNGVALAGSGGDNVIDVVAPSGTAISWDVTRKYFAGKSVNVTELAKTGSVKAQVVFEDANTTGDVATTTKLGAAVTKSVTARKVATWTASAVRSVTAKNTGTGTASVALNSTFELKATAKDSSTTPVAVAGVPVSVSIDTNAVLASTAGAVVSITVNGTTYTDVTKLPGKTGIAKIATTTDASGIAKVTITTAGYTGTPTVTATFEAENFSSNVVATSAAIEYSAFLENDALAAGTTSATILAGETVPVNVLVRDQFGGVPADSKYEVNAKATTSDAGNTRTTDISTTNGTSDFVASVVAGKATVNVVDKGKGVGYDAYTIGVFKKAAAGGYVDASTDDISNTINASGTVAVLTVNVVANKTAGVITVTPAVKNTSGVYVVGTSATTADKFDLSKSTFAAFDGRTSIADEPTISNFTAISGKVQLADTTDLDGVSVTIAGKGLAFSATGTTPKVYGVDSLTIVTNASGEYAFGIASNVAGKQTVTLTSGSFSQTLEITFKAAAARDGSALTVSAPAYVLPGRTITVTGLLVDKYGNAVDTDQASATAASAAGSLDSTDARFTVAYDGPGLVVGSLPVETDATGAFSFKVLLGAAEVGTGTVKATYGAANGEIASADTGSDKDIVASATFTIGAAPVVAPTVVVAISGSTGKVYVSVTNAAGKKVVVKVSAKFAKSFTGTLAKKSVAVLAAKGSKKITVYVGGKLVATKTVTIK